MWFLDNVVVSTTEAATVAMQSTNPNITPSTVVPPYRPMLFGAGGGSSGWSFQRPQMGQTGINISVLTAITNPAFSLRWGATGVRVSADFFKPFDHTAMVIGDSFSEGSSVSRAEETWQYIVIDSLEKYTRKRWRIINKSKGGYRCVDADHMFSQGMLYVPHEPRVIYVALGTNDTDATAYENALGRLLRGLVRTYPAAVIIVCAPAVRTDLSSQEMTNALIRLAAARQVSAIGKSTCVLVNWGTAWSSATSTPYLHGDKIHPIAAGHAVLGALSFSPFLTNKSLLAELL
jgi:lysophospholipase L1-like esterase